jgi:hypothetical protein
MKNAQLRHPTAFCFRTSAADLDFLLDALAEARQRVSRET